MLSARACAATALAQVLEGRSLTQVIPSLESHVRDNDRGFFNDLVRGSCRYYPRLNALSKILLKTPFGPEQQVFHALLVVGLYQLHVQKKPAHAAIFETVNACTELNGAPFKAVINACLRRFEREHDALLAPLNDSDVTRYNHPKWLINQLKRDWPEHWADILTGNNQQAPLCLRVNARQTDRDAYLATLSAHGLNARPSAQSADGIYLEAPVPVSALPHFDEGFVSVQDEAAQLAAALLLPTSMAHTPPAPARLKVLDACAAPGGKTCHLLERADCDLTAMDIDATRLLRVQENAERLGLSPKHIVQGSITKPDTWWDGEPFDAILLDAPCSATGVIRRHPDIKLLRQKRDIDALAEIQATALDKAWHMLKPGGRLLYATCSVLACENSGQIAQFLARTADATLLPMDKFDATPCNAGMQLFPTGDGHDGFYYALLERSENKPCKS